MLGVALLALRRHSYGPLQVSFVGKAATLCLLYAFPLLFLGSHAGSYAEVTRVTGWAFAIWGTCPLLVRGRALPGTGAAGLRGRIGRRPHRQQRADRGRPPRMGHSWSTKGGFRV